MQARLPRYDPVAESNTCRSRRRVEILYESPWPNLQPARPPQDLHHSRGILESEASLQHLWRTRKNVILAALS